MCDRINPPLMIRAVSGALNQHAATRADDTRYYKANGQQKKKESKKERAADPKESPRSSAGVTHSAGIYGRAVSLILKFSAQKMTIITAMSRVRS